jgi:SAM-dependent methyltransferase
VSEPRRASAPDDAILNELVDAARRFPDRQLLQFRSRIGANQYRRLYRLVRRFTREGAAVLDWGSGNGHFTYFLQRSGRAAHGFSLLPGTFRAWIPDPDYPFVQGDESEPVRLPYADATFDAVVSGGVLEHVRETSGDESKSLREIVRVLKPGGVFICYHFPNRHSLIDRLARRFPSMHRHEFRYTAREIRELAGGAGLRIEAMGRYGSLPRNSAGALPDAIARSRAVAAVWDAADGVLGAILSRWCQNYYFVGRKRARSS